QSPCVGFRKTACACIADPRAASASDSPPSRSAVCNTTSSAAVRSVGTSARCSMSSDPRRCIRVSRSASQDPRLFLKPDISKYWIRGISVPSRGVSIVIIEHAAEPLSSSDSSCFCGDPFDWSDKPIFQALMISFSVIMRKEFSYPVPQGLLTKEDHLLHAVFLDGANEPFRVCVQIWGSRWQFDGLNSGPCENIQKLRRV